MARPLRILVADGVYHVTSRGHARNPIYRTDADRITFFEILERTLSRFDWRCLSYCLMDNHFHLLIRTPQPNLSRGMQQLKSGYARIVNRRYGGSGPLFDDRFHAPLVQRDAHVLEVLRYLALNPVRAGLCDEPEGWTWSAHSAIAGLTSPPPFLAAEESRELFAGASGTDGIRAYREYVARGEATDVPDVAVIGDDAFRREMLASVVRDAEIPRRYWGPGRPPIVEIMAGRDQVVAMAEAYRDHGYTMSEIAAHVGCHVSTVSRRIHAYERQMHECKI
jgi:REP element-mobilizing transposase RayT